RWPSSCVPRTSARPEFSPEVLLLSMIRDWFLLMGILQSNIQTVVVSEAAPPGADCEAAQGGHLHVHRAAGLHVRDSDAEAVLNAFAPDVPERVRYADSLSQDDVIDVSSSRAKDQDY